MQNDRLIILNAIIFFGPLENSKKVVRKSNLKNLLDGEE